MYDTLCRHFLPNYGNEWVIAPNFERLAKRSIQFENFYVGSMPCMPARREMHTGRYNFLHRSWGPLEPFDDSMPSILHDNGVHSHKVTDHLHYWEDGGATYHQRYTTFDLVRGQEGDKWKGDVEKQKEDYIGLRISVMAGGCSGFQYGFEFATEKNKDDRRHSPMSADS